MRHNRQGRQLSRSTSHRKAMLRNLVTSLFQHERITTTLAKAKEGRRYAERLITVARKDGLPARRRVSAYLRSEAIAKKLMEDIAPRFKERPGGYTRIYRLGPRHGDAGEMAILELVERRVDGEKTASGEAKGAKTAKGKTARSKTRETAPAPAEKDKPKKTRGAAKGGRKKEEDEGGAKTAKSAKATKTSKPSKPSKSGAAEKPGKEDGEGKRATKPSTRKATGKSAADKPDKPKEGAKKRRFWSRKKSDD